MDAQAAGLGFLPPPKHSSKEMLPSCKRHGHGDTWWSMALEIDDILMARANNTASRTTSTMELKHELTNQGEHELLEQHHDLADLRHPLHDNSLALAAVRWLAASVTTHHHLIASWATR